MSAIERFTRAATHLAIRTSGPVHFVQLDRPECANAYTQTMLVALLEQVEFAEGSPQIRMLVLTGAGDCVFCAGADRDELSARDWSEPLNLLSARVFRRVRESRLMTIAAINGAAVGGGVELALACDFRLAAQSARFWLPETELGILPAAGGTEWLPDLVGLARAKELVLAGTRWTAEEALQYGLVSEVVPDEELMHCVDAWCHRIANRHPLALQLAKRALHSRSGDTALVAQALLVRTQQEAGAGNSGRNLP